ncbi:hypothetical protein TNCT_249111 [Trichonephila clavata]|uniref:Uncharacterized protein n=1 Tax=Trichonephila clavata TaxID=2740835 RepID=A0A8X6H8X7_TRICU|nr:hypothetical protein TNCT_249111 [Trichonephila clavata]
MSFQKTRFRIDPGTSCEKSPFFFCYLTTAIHTLGRIAPILGSCFSSGHFSKLVKSFPTEVEAHGLWERLAEAEILNARAQSEKSEAEARGERFNLTWGASAL